MDDPILIPAAAEENSETDTELTAVDKRQQIGLIIGLIVGIIVILSIVVLAVYFLLQDGGRTETIRDIFIIFMAFESLVIGAALIILIIQVSRLINLLQNEVQPILESTSEAVNTLRGTTEFLGAHMVEPVMKLNEYLASIKRLADIVNITRRNKD